MKAEGRRRAWAITTVALLYVVGLAMVVSGIALMARVSVFLVAAGGGLLAVAGYHTWSFTREKKDEDDEEEARKGLKPRNCPHYWTRSRCGTGGTMCTPPAGLNQTLAFQLDSMTCERTRSNEYPYTEFEHLCGIMPP